MLRLNLAKFRAAKAKTTKTKSRSTNAPRSSSNTSKYCDHTIVPEIGHKHMIRAIKPNDHLRHIEFVIVGFTDDNDCILEKTSGARINIKTIKNGKPIETLVQQVIKPVSDLVYNSDNKYREIRVDGRRVKKNHRLKQYRALETGCVIKLLDCDPIVNNCAFMVKRLIDKGDHYECVVINGKKLENDINPIDYLDLIDGGYKFVVVASKQEVLTDISHLYGYVKDAKIMEKASAPFDKGLLSQQHGRAKVVINDVTYNVTPEQQEIFQSDLIPVDEEILIDEIDHERRIVKLIGLDV